MFVVSEPRAVERVSKLVSEPGAVAMGSNNSAKLDDPVATTTPRGLPAWGPRSALGSDTAYLSLGSVAKSKQSAKRTKVRSLMRILTLSIALMVLAVRFIGHERGVSQTLPLPP